jgi:hypothetical protein
LKALGRRTTKKAIPSAPAVGATIGQAYDGTFLPFAIGF